MRWRDRLPSAGELALWQRVTRSLARHEPAPPPAVADGSVSRAREDARRPHQVRSGAAVDGDAAPLITPTVAPAIDGESAVAWHDALRGVALLPGRAAPAPPERHRETTPVITPAPTPGSLARVAAAPGTARQSLRLDRSRPMDLDRRSWLKLRRGLYPIEARLDLHGMTQDQAFTALDGFLAGARGRGQRCVLVITGRGLRHGGTLRSATPRWLEATPLRGRVLAYADAQLRHGGDGALYVLLKRRE